MAEMIKAKGDNTVSHFLTDDEMKKIQDDLDAQFRAVFMGLLSTSPSSDDSDYEYQEPEQDEQGTLYGYKYLSWDGEAFHSPSWYAEWNNGQLTSDKPPGEGHMHGIHFTKRQDHPALDEYAREDFYVRSRIRVIVKCALSGTVVETAQGFRAEHAQIIGVKADGNWKSYSDYQGCARPHPRSNPYYKETERPTRWIADWDGAYTSDDSNP